MDKRKKNKKHRVRKLGSDQDYLSAFFHEENKDRNTPDAPAENTGKINKHGLPFVADYESRFTERQDSPKEEPGVPGRHEPEAEEDFSQLLAQYLKDRPPPRKKPEPVPLKKRLKRYPGPEADLDLHGFTAIGARARAQSFVLSALHQGFFTVRVIVGKGKHSPEGPVLPHVVEDLLKEMKQEKTILSYEWEGGRRSKSGALIIFLNRFND